MMYDADYMEQEYRRFLEKNEDARDASYIEYLGVNFSEDASAAPVFKAYYTTTRSRENVPPVLRPLLERNMVRALNKIDDTVNNGYVRYEIGLGNRSNDNMMFVCQWMRRLFPQLNGHWDEISRFFRIKSARAAGYDYAALYFLGLIVRPGRAENPDVKAVKLHYLLRMCMDPDRIGRNYTVDSRKYLAQLAGLGIPQMRELAGLAEELLGTEEAELWMAAADYYRTGLRKYKLYLKNYSEGVYTALTDRLREAGCANLVRQLCEYLQWIRLHPELERYGLAVCLDSGGVWSVNLYH